jgi:hypothetical protein
MGNAASIDKTYQNYLIKSNEQLLDMSKDLASNRLREINKISSRQARNSTILFVITSFVQFLYGDDMITASFGPPPKDIDNPLIHLTYEMNLISHLRHILFNEKKKDVLPEVTNYNAEERMWFHFFTYVELSGVVQSMLQHFGNLEFHEEQKDKFDLTYVDFKTTADINEFLASPIQLTKNSSSDSIVFRGLWQHTLVFAKTFEKRKVSLLYEKELYRYIKNTASAIGLENEIKRHFILPKFSCEYGPMNRIASVTEDSGGLSVARMIHDYQILSELEFLAILFQLLCIITILHRLGISHNDIHDGNIIAKPGDAPFSSFSIHGKTYDILPHSTKFICKIYDFDNSTYVNAENVKLNGDFCNQTGICNRKDTEKDVFNVLMLLHMKFSGEKYAAMKHFRNLLFMEMRAVDPQEAADLEALVKLNLSDTRRWQKYCLQKSSRCQDTSSKLMCVFTFLDMYCRAMKKL